MELRRKKLLFGRIGDSEVFVYTISSGMVRASILSYGARLQSLVVGETRVVAGFDDIRSYVADTHHFGGVIGRLCNRTRDGVLQIGNQTYLLEKNKNGYHMHGGSSCFDDRLWSLVALDATSITLALDCPDGEANYPGNIRVEVTYSIHENSLIFSYMVESDKATKVNITNHSYFNLKGEGDVLGHTILINSEEIAVRDKEYLFTPFREPYSQDSPYLLEKVAKSACYLLQNEEACMVHYDRLSMKVSTSLPAMLLYCADSLQASDDSEPSRHARYCGFCPETLFLPNDVPILELGQRLQEWTKYEFSYV